MARPPLFPSLFAGFGLSAAALSAQPIDFNTQIRPILNQNCTSCHGGVKAAGDVSFVYRDVVGQIGKKSGKPVITPGQPDASELIKRIISSDKDYRMPPADHGPALPAEKVALLRRWIEQGAPWQDHWAFVPPQPQAVPAVKSEELGQRSRGAVDRFVWARLEREGLTPAAEASRAALLRRVSLDLTGLPPTPEELAAFTKDSSANAFEKQVDRLLASPHFGERWASPWLDLARYADTKGYEKDDHRTVWNYRDWVVDALNRNLPYDKFVIEQLAGDLLPQATLEQYVATSFHRQTQVNDEGGTDDEEYRIAAVIDRLATTWQVTNAVTFNCVQCHSHPYDPIKHEEFYKFFAVFNGTRDADFNNELPTLRVPDARERYAEAWGLRREVETLRREVVAAGLAAERATAWKPAEILTARAVPDATIAVKDSQLRAEGTISTNARFDLTLPLFPLSQTPITALRFESEPDEPEKAQHTPERGFIVTQLEVAIAFPDGSVKPVGVGRYFPDTENLNTITTKTLPRPKPTDTPTAVATDAALAAVGADVDRAQSKKGKKGGNAKGGATIASSIPTTQTPNASASASAPTSTPASAPVPAPAAAPAQPASPPEMRDVTLDFHFAANPTISGKRWVVAALREPLVVPPGATLRISVVHGRGITEKPAPVRRLRVATTDDPRWNALGADASLHAKSERVSEALAELAKIPGADLPILTELPANERRQTRVFGRGNFLDKKGAALEPGVPALFPKLARVEGKPVDRLAVAQWFFQPGQPLTARVAVNRFWEQLFGAGLVGTLEDFGSVGDRPSHPELLDWLALHFERELKWDIKALLRELVLSATYRQDGRVAPESLAKDPQNRLLGRGPRQRLTAEMVRDQALAASGLLSRKLGGPPVMPPQPDGVWQTVYNNKPWTTSKGEDRYRRALYTFAKRSAVYPSFLSFDMPSRDLCTARRTPTNTPLQALVTLNDPVYYEAAAALGERAIEATSASDIDAQIAWAFARVISRAPTDGEAKRLRQLYDDSRAAAPESKPLTPVAAAILNLDAAFVR